MQRFGTFHSQTHGSLKRAYTASVRTGTWTPNSHTLLVELAAYDEQTHGSSWYCYYDLENHRFYLDETLKKRDLNAAVFSDTKI